MDQILEVYRYEVKKAYSEMVKQLMAKGWNKALATNSAYQYYYFDIEALKEGKIAENSSLPRYRKYY